MRGDAAGWCQLSPPHTASEITAVLLLQQENQQENQQEMHNISNTRGAVHILLDTNVKSL